MLVIAVTGAIGSGKSKLIEIFNQLGVVSFSADSVNKQLIQPHTTFYQKIVDRFGSKFLHSDGSLNTKALRTHIFRYNSDKVWLEQLLHPEIILKLRREVASLTDKSYCLIEIPVITNALFQGFIHRILLVEAEHEVRVKRVTARDNISLEEANMIVAKQRNDLSNCNVEIDKIINHGNQEQLKIKAQHLHERYLTYVTNLQN